MEAKLQEKPGKAIVSHPCYVRVGICTSDGPTGMPYEDIGLFLFDKRIRMPIERNFFVVSAEAEGLIGVRDGLWTENWRRGAEASQPQFDCLVTRSNGLKSAIACPTVERRGWPG